VKMRYRNRFAWRGWLLWAAGFVSFPIAGICAYALAGGIDGAGAALLGGLAAGAVIGTGQWLVARRDLGNAWAWIATTAGAMGVGLLAGAAIVGYGTSLRDVATMGAITGIPLGAAQAFVLQPRVPHAWTWAVAMPALWALGWTVTTTAGIDLERRYAVFGTARSLIPPPGRTLPASFRPERTP
jgi:hypothetical protein